MVYLLFFNPSASLMPLGCPWAEKGLRNKKPLTNCLKTVEL